MGTLTLCMINYNGEAYLERSLSAALAQRPRCQELLLVDSASADSSISLIARRFPDVRIVRLDRNGGPAAARNEGFRAASCDRILFLDGDMILPEDLAARLGAALDADPDAAVAVPRVLYADAPNIVQFDGAECHFLGGMTLHHAGWHDRDVPAHTRRVGSLGTGCFLVDRQRLGVSQPFDESFLFNYEDHDFGVGTRLRGREILAVSSARCRHLHGTPGLSLRPGGRYASLRVYCLIRNRWLVLLKYFQWQTLLLLAPMLFAYELAQLATVIAKGWLPEWARAVGWIVRHLPAILGRRRAVQQERRVPDRELLSGGPLPFREELTPTPLQRTAKAALDRLAVGYWQLVMRLV